MVTFSTYLAMRPHRGYQPAALGHIQTLADLVDDWKTDRHGRLWRGNKLTQSGDEAISRHAETSCWTEKLDTVQKEDLYI